MPDKQLPLVENERDIFQALDILVLSVHAGDRTLLVDLMSGQTTTGRKVVVELPVCSIVVVRLTGLGLAVRIVDAVLVLFLFHNRISYFFIFFRRSE